MNTSLKKFFSGWAMRLTILRVVLIPLFILTYYIHPQSWGQWLALGVYSIACISDFFDGWLARNLKEESAFGAFLDPVADKLMVAAVLIVLIQQNPTIWLMFCALIVIGREIWISALREWMSGIGHRGVVAVSKWGKWKTTVQMFSMGFLIYREDWIGLPIWRIGQVLMLIAAVLTIVSMWQYTAAAYRYFRESMQTA
ncbi:MAG: CDP-diacylglycerol--glycerol-3-phosphate 3-phosphatidyltransferase [Cardiobacteriaceae bacterium]|nr:CDP-diacylglycerol--glycerol-3-phosphate 3-phosphatidyltransferase [Cardiobacteriaceae bacterium]